MKKKVCRRWTEEEKNYVIDNWGTLTIRYMAKKIGRTEKALISFGEKNKLGSPYKVDYISTIEAGEIVGVDQTTIIHWINEYGLKSRFKAMVKRKKYLIDLDDFRKFLRDNQHLWKACNVEEYALGREEDWLKEKRKTDSDLEIMKKGTLWSTKEEQEALELFKQGLNAREVSRKINRTYIACKKRREKFLRKGLLERVA